MPLPGCRICFNGLLIPLMKRFRLVCDSNINQYYNYRDSSFNTVNMWISGLPNWTPGPDGLAGNSQWFMTSCSGGLRPASHVASATRCTEPSDLKAYIRHVSHDRQLGRSLPPQGRNPLRMRTCARWRQYCALLEP